MEALFNSIREISMFSVTVRMLMAALCGGCIGMEREYKRRHAGFRTHILICVGAAAAAMTNQYMALYMHYYTDMARMGAQVVTGVGFIGAGTIIVSRSRKVKGLTTAAGLWAAAIIGLAIGSGFIEGGVFAAVIVLAAESLFSRFESAWSKNAPEVILFVEYESAEHLENVMQFFIARSVRVLDMQITRDTDSEEHRSHVIFTLRLNRQNTADFIIEKLKTMNGITNLEEL